MNHIFLVLSLFLSGVIFAQEQKEFKKDSLQDKNIFVIIKNDSATINLQPVFVLKHLRFKTSREGLYYYWYRKKVLKAYPFATLAADRLTELNKQLENIKSKHKRRRHIRKIQKYMQGEFTSQLKKLTRTEGKILIKLIYRQTGKTVFNLIKEYRSGWKAFWYQTTARIFKLSLKKEYHPEKIGKDFIIEDILQRAYISGSLKPQPSKMPINFQQISSHYKNISYEKEIISKD